MSNITPEAKAKKIAYIKEGIALGRPFQIICQSLKADSNNLRAFMVRNGIEIPANWVPRKWTRYRGEKVGYVKKGTQSAAHTRASKLGRKTSIVGQSLTADPSGLTYEERTLADSLRIPYDRMAYLLKCPKEGNATGWNGGNAIG